MDIRRNGGPTKVNFVFVKCKGVTSYRINNTPPIDRTLPASVENQIGREVSTKRFGFQHDLFEIVPTLHQSEIDITFTGPDIRIYALMFLETGYELDIDTRFDRETHTKIDRTGILHEDTEGGLARTRRRGSGRWAWKSEYNILFEDDAYDTFLFWLENNPNVFFSQGFTNTPNRIYPAAVTKSTYEAVGRSDVKSEGSYVAFMIEEHIGKAETQVTSQNNDPPIVPLPEGVGALSADASVRGRITVSWRPPRNAADAHIRYYEWREQGGTFERPDTNTSHTLENVDARVYVLEVRAVGQGGTGAVSRVTVTGVSYPAIGQVETLSVTSPAYNRVVITFDPASNEVAAQVIQYEYRVGNGAYVRIPYVADQDTYRIPLNGVAEGDYTYYVRARGIRGASAPVSQTVRVEDPPAIPEVVRHVRLVSNNPNELTLTFDAPLNIADAALAAYWARPVTTPVSDYVNIGTDRTETFTGIARGAWTYEVYAEGESGNGPAVRSNTETVSNPTPLAVEDLEVDTETDGSAVLTWSAPSNITEAVLDRYRVRRVTTPASNWIDVGTDLTYTAFIPTTAEYTYEVQAVGLDGEGVSTPITFEADAHQQPQAIRSLRLDSPNNNEIRIRFNPPSNRESSGVTHYRYTVMGVENRSATAFGDGSSGRKTHTLTNLVVGAYMVEVRAARRNPDNTVTLGPATSGNVTVTSSVAAPMVVRNVTIGAPAYNVVEIDWDDPANAAAATIKWNQYRPVTTPESAWITLGTATLLRLTGVAAGSHTYQIRAFGLGGAGAEFTTSAVQVSDPPPIPFAARNLAVDVMSGYYQAVLTWDAPSNFALAAVARYEHRSKLSSERWPAADADDQLWEAVPLDSDSTPTIRTVTITGFREESHDFQVRVVGESGESSEVTVTATPRIRPTALAPTIGTPVITRTGFTVDITPPSNAVAANIRRYEYQIGTGAWQAGPNVPTDKTDGIDDYAIAVATSGTISVKFRAYGQEGAGAASSALSVVIPSLPAAPSLALNVATQDQIILTITAPTDAAATGVTHYQWKLSTSSTWNDLAAGVLTHTITDHDPGEVTYQVRAVGTRGAGAIGSETATVETAGPPAPTNIRTTFSLGSTIAIFAWNRVSYPGYSNLQYEWKFSSRSTWVNAGIQPSTRVVLASDGLANGAVFQVRAYVVDDGVRITGSIGEFTYQTGQGAEFPRPGPPTAAIYSFDRDEVTMSWGQPANTGGLPVLEYFLQGSGVSVSVSPDANGNGSATFITPHRGQTTVIRIRARTAVGWGIDTLNIPISPPLNAPEQIEALEVEAAPSRDGVIITWSDTFDYGGIRNEDGIIVNDREYDYKIWSGGAEPSEWTEYAPTASADRYRLHLPAATFGAASSWKFKIRARNSVGAGPDSDVLSFTYPLS